MAEVAIGIDRQGRALTEGTDDRRRIAAAVALDRGDVAVAVGDGGQPARAVVGELVAQRAGHRVQRLQVPAVRREHVHLAAVFRWDDCSGRAHLRGERCDPAHAHVDVASRELPDVSGIVNVGCNRVETEGKCPNEAVAAVAGREVMLTQPVPVYVENFLGFPVGVNAPVGYYDPDAAAWVPSGCFP